MSKMREAFEKWYATRMYATPFAYRIAEDGFEAGYQAAIAAIREGGPAAWIHPNAETFPKHVANSIPVYTLPEDLL